MFQTCHAVNRLPERLLKLFPGSRPHLLVKSGYFISITKEVTALDSGVKVLKGEQTAGLAWRLARGAGGGGGVVYQPFILSLSWQRPGSVAFAIKIIINVVTLILTGIFPTASHGHTH